MVAPAGIEPATLGLEVPCSDPTELRSHIDIFLIILYNIAMSVARLQANL
jgi:hypothetical protein